MSAKNVAAGGRAPRSWLITALLASLAVAYVAFIFVPAQASIGTLRGQLNERRQHILQAQSLVLPVAHASKQLTATKEVTDKWRSAAPNASELSANFALLTTEAKAAGVVIERFDPQTPAELQVLSQHAVNVHFHGPFADVFDFLRRIEELPATVWISNLRIGTDGESTATLRGELNLTIFVDRTGSSD
jgi:Tfp pilus assembly protein PilO